VPVVAFDAAAVQKTVAGAGLVLNDKSPGVVAAAVERIVSDDPLRERLVQLGSERASQMRAGAVRPQWQGFFADLLRSDLLKSKQHLR